jgi:magnesium transporter
LVHIIGHGRKPAGSPPGTVVYIGEEKAHKVTIHSVRFNGQELDERTDVSVTECVPPANGNGVVWYLVDGIHDVAILQKIGENFGLHPLVIEDIANTGQRPKIEDFDSYIFLTLKMITYEDEQIRVEHVSLVMGSGFVISFLEDEGDVFDPVRARIRAGRGRIRKAPADYLLYALIDAIVDGYFEVLEELGDDIEEVEQEVVVRPSRDTLKSIHGLKRELIYTRRAVWPLREAVSVLVRDESHLVSDDTKVFLRDLYDHSIQVIDTVETLRDIVSGMLDVYLSSISNKMNEIMKVLTVMSSIFIPLTFVAGVYGMNFKYMPELESPWGYPLTLLGMAAVALGLLGLFRRWRWI